MNVIVRGRFSGPAGLLRGSPRILSGSRTAALPNTEMCCKTRRQKPSQRAACRCLAITSLNPGPNESYFITQFNNSMISASQQ